jgi:hypothetical protein
MARTRFSTRAIEKLGFYVYAYVDPRDGTIFYVGKGNRNRCFAHLPARDAGVKSRRIAELRKLGQEPRIEILRHGLTEKEAFEVEGAVIDALGLLNLGNAVIGHQSRDRGRAEWRNLHARLDARPIDIRDPCVLININREYRPTMSVVELYDATRSAWKVGTRKSKARYALAIYRGVVREVFTISAWVPGGTTMQARHADGRSRVRKGRFEFVGHVAEEGVRKRYLNRDVREHFPPGAQNPIKYAGC